MSKSKIKVVFLGCTKNPLKIVYSALKLKYSEENGKSIWDNIQDNKFSEDHILNMLVDKIDPEYLEPLKEMQFVFLLENISHLGLEKLHEYQTAPRKKQVFAATQKISEKKNNIFTAPESIRKNAPVFEKWRKLQADISDFYKFSIENGINKEDVDFALPKSTLTRDQLVIGFKRLQSFLDYSMCESAYWELKEISWQIYRLIDKEFPQLIDRLGIKCWENRRLYCSESYQQYCQCRWNQSRPHQNDLTIFWKSKQTNSNYQQLI